MFIKIPSVHVLYTSSLSLTVFVIISNVLLYSEYVSIMLII